MVFPLSPGPVDTEMSAWPSLVPVYAARLTALLCVVHNSLAADKTGVFRAIFADAPPQPAVATVVASLLALVDNATREKRGGEFVHVDGTHIAW